MGGECLLEPRGEVVVSEAAAALDERTLRRRHRRSLCLGEIDQADCILGAPEPHVGLREIPGWCDVELEVADGTEALVHPLEQLPGRIKPADRKLEPAECAFGALTIETETDRVRQLDRGSRVVSTRLLVSRRCIDVGQNPVAGTGGRTLADLIGDRDSVTCGRVGRPPVADLERRACHQPLRLRQHTEGALLSRGVGRTVSVRRRGRVTSEHVVGAPGPKEILRGAERQVSSIDDRDRTRDQLCRVGCSRLARSGSERLRDEELRPRIERRAERAKPLTGCLHGDAVELDAYRDRLGQEQGGPLRILGLGDRRGLHERVERGSLIVVQHGKPPPDAQQRRSHQVTRATGQALVHQFAGVARVSGELCGVRGLGEPRRLLLSGGGQACGALERPRCRVVCATVGRSAGDMVELCGYRRIGANRSGGEVPSVALAVAICERGGEGRVNAAALGGRGTVVDRRPDERMGEPEVRAVSSQ